MVAHRTLVTHDRGLDGEDLPLETALGHRLRRCCWERRPSQSVSAPGDAVLRGDALRRAELVGHVPGKVGRAGTPRTVHDVGPQSHPAHGLDAAGDPHLDGVGGDEVVHEVVGLLGRAALAVDRRRRHLVGEPLLEPRRPGDVGGLLAGLGDAAADDLLHRRRVDAGPLDQFDLGGTEEGGGVGTREPAVPLADGRAHRLDDHCLSHVATLPTWPTALLRVGSNENLFSSYRSIGVEADPCRPARSGGDAEALEPEGPDGVAPGELVDLAPR